MRHAHRVNMKFKYTKASETDITKTFDQERARLTAEAEKKQVQADANISQLATRKRAVS